MTEIETIRETPISMVGLAEKLDAIKKRDKELDFKANKTREYLNLSVGKKKTEHVNEVIKKLNDLGIVRLKDKQVIKIADLLPEDIDSLKNLLAGENLTLKQEDYQRIVECLK